MRTAIVRIIFTIPLLLVLHASSAFAEIPYETGYVNPHQETATWPVQPVYVPDRLVIGISDDGIKLKEPGDLFITANDHVFVADTGNHRIVELNPQGEFIRTIGDSEGAGRLQAPEGVFVNESGLVYVADTGNSRVAVFDREGRYVREQRKPQTHLLPESVFFVPSKLVVDQRGVMYVVSKGSYQGIIRINSEGTFTGFFGANKAELTVLQRFQRLILSKGQLQREAANRPTEIANVTITPQGFLLTANFGVYSGQIKKLNAGGIDSLANKSFAKAYQLVDVAIDEAQFIYTIDRDTGKIAIFDRNGKALFRFGDVDREAQQLGLFGYPTSLAVNSSKEIWVTDSRQNTIQVFKRTRFGDTFFQATHLYNQGYYKESEPLWREVQRQNELVLLAYQGFGKAALSEGGYSDALAYFITAYDAEGYSKAFWNLRMKWLERHLVAMLAAAVAAALAGWLALRLVRRKGRRPRSERLSRYIQEWKDLGYLMLHPYEGFYRLKERRISVITIISILLLAALLNIARSYFSGYILDQTDRDDINVVIPLLLLFVPWLTWVIANYLVSTVKYGEGRLREVLQASAYALVPYLVFSLPFVLLSNVVVLEEKIIVTAIDQMMWFWLAALLFVMTQVIHNFDFMETVKNIAITLFTIVVLWIFLLIMAGLCFNLFNFFYEVYKEVSMNG